ncbi:MAG: preprotein translocase subunit YajC [Myxococcaceae bacterium]|nr:preprotein translocase subunit YajC [Myxococcaceae bacterium]
MAFYLVAMGAIVYFLIIRPQRQQQKEHEGLVTSLKTGDDVILQSGLFGKIAAVTDRDVMLEISKGVKVRVLKSSVQGKVTVEAPKADEAAKKEEK